MNPWSVFTDLFPEKILFQMQLLTYLKIEF